MSAREEREREAAAAAIAVDVHYQPCCCALPPGFSLFFTNLVIMDMNTIPVLLSFPAKSSKTDRTAARGWDFPSPLMCFSPILCHIFKLFTLFSFISLFPLPLICHAHATVFAFILFPRYLFTPFLLLPE
jgi:hypothetical protein